MEIAIAGTATKMMMMPRLKRGNDWMEGAKVDGVDFERKWMSSAHGVAADFLSLLLHHRQHPITRFRPNYELQHIMVDPKSKELKIKS